MSSNAILSVKDDCSNQTNPRVMMWCVPRSVSTALTKCMSFIDGSEVWFEPYFHSKATSDAYGRYHPNEDFPMKLDGNEDVFREAAKKLMLDRNVDDTNIDLLSPVILKQIFDNLDPSKKFVFIKDMAKGMPPSRYQYLPNKSSGIKHLFLIRHPVKTYKSFRKCLLDFLLAADPRTFQSQRRIPDRDKFHLIDSLTPLQEGTRYVFQGIHELWNHIRSTMAYEPVILDVDDLLENPSAMLPCLCNALGIPYSESLLSWDPSPDVVLTWKSSCSNLFESPRYAMWFTNAFKSSCFNSSSTSASLDDATDDVKEVVKKEMPFYEEMYAKRLTT